jgi:hypothetical protein
MEKFDTAQICTNGHLISSATETKPHTKRDFCDKCGAETICNCPNCKKPIKGDYLGVINNENLNNNDKIRELLDSLGFHIPQFCDSCGHEFPWFQKKLELVFEFVEYIDSLTFQQKNDFKSSINELIKQTSKLPMAKIELKKILSSLDKDISDNILDLMKEILPRNAMNDLSKVLMENTASHIWKILRTGKDVQFMNFNLRYKSDEIVIMKGNPNIQNI